jgi:arylsulfatase A-like enzyme
MNWSIKLTILLVWACSLASLHAAADTSRPNLVVIVVDDMRWNEFGAGGHPYVETPNIDRLAKEGVQFTAAYAVSPLCSPNRASILTGQYISRHGIVDNIARDLASHQLPLFPQALQRAGYTTAHVGKWHMGNDPTPRPGYDYWVSFPGQGRSTNPELYEDGRLHEVQGYMTDLLTDRAVSFIHGEKDQPFFLYMAHKAIHADAKQNADASVDKSYGVKYVPAPRHQGRYAGKVLPRRENVVPFESLRGKPVVKQTLAVKNSDALEPLAAFLDLGTAEKTIRDRAEMLLAVDDSVGQVLDALEAAGVLDNTAVLLTSDNGYFYGEHGLSVERRMPYEESVRLPMLLRYPKLVQAGTSRDEFVLSIDIAPTMLALAGAQPGDHIQGRSLVPLLNASGEAPADWRNSFLMEYVSYEKPMPWLVNTSYKAIRSGPYKYVHWIQHPKKGELYNLEQDPYESNNLIDSAEHRDLLKGLKSELGDFIVEALSL